LIETIRDPNLDNRRHYASKKCVQGTAVVSVISVLITVTICALPTTMVMHVLMMAVRSKRIRVGLCAGKRRRHDARELGK